MILQFTLSMPNVGSWNGKWSGSGNLYARVKNIGRTKKAVAHGKGLIEQGNFYYSFGDGWGASVAVKEITAKEAAKVRRETKGFYGYEWMIRSILLHGEIKYK